MFPKLSLLIVVTLLTACAAPTAPASSPASTMTTIPPTQTPPVVFATEIPAPTASPEPPAPTETPMTLNDWKEVFSGPSLAPNGEEGRFSDLSYFFNEKNSRILTSVDEILNAPPLTVFIILNDRQIVIWATSDEATKAIENGGTVLTPPKPNTNGGALATFAIEAANTQYLKNKREIEIVFNENDWPMLPVSHSLEFYGSDSSFIIKTTPDGRFYTPLIKRPKYFVVYKDNLYEMYPKLEDLPQDEFWIDQLIKAGYEGISAYITNPESIYR